MKKVTVLVSLIKQVSVTYNPNMESGDDATNRAYDEAIEAIKSGDYDHSNLEDCFEEYIDDEIEEAS